jgi:hypothetical protein
VTVETREIKAGAPAGLAIAGEEREAGVKSEKLRVADCQAGSYFT